MDRVVFLDPGGGDRAPCRGRCGRPYPPWWRPAPTQVRNPGRADHKGRPLRDIPRRVRGTALGVPLHDQTADPGHRHGVVHRHGDVLRHARRAGRPAHERQGRAARDPRQPGGTLRTRQANRPAVLDLSQEHGERRLRHLVHPAEPRGQRHHPRALQGLRDLGHPRHRVRGVRRHPLGCPDGALPQPDAGHRDHVPGHPGDLGAGVRVRRAWAVERGGDQRLARLHAVPRRRLGHRAAHDRAVDGARSRHHGVPDAPDALVDARDRQLGLHPHRPVQGPAGDPHPSQTSVAQRHSCR